LTSNAQLKHNDVMISGPYSAHSTEWRSLYPFESRWLDLPSGRMHYLDERNTEGEGGLSDADALGQSATESPPTRGTLLFVHGNPTWSFHWRRLILALRNRYRCIAPDHLGCGLSGKPRHFLRLEDHIASLDALVRKLDLAHVTLVAQDWGGAIGLGAMLRMPERLQRIVLFNTGAFPPPYIPWRIRLCRMPFIGRLAVQGANAFSRAALRMTLARRRKLEPEVAAGYLAPYDTWANRRAVYGFVQDIPTPRCAATHDEGILDPSTSGRLAAIEHMLPSLANRPSLLIWGMRDWCFRPDCLARFEVAWPNAEVHRLADVGHWVVEDVPEEAFALVERFLDSSDQLTMKSSCPIPDAITATTSVRA
jgi:haloalkane dehalogenase